MLINDSRINTKQLANKADFTMFFFFILFMIFCFGVVYTANTSDIIKDIKVYHFEVNIKLIIGICIFFSVFALVKGGKTDKITVALLCSAILGVIPYAYVENTISYWGNYLPLIISFMTYYICSQSKAELSKILFNIVCLVSIILSVQVILTELSYFSTLSFSNFNNVLMKAYMNLPIGSSNLISAYLLPLLVFIISFKRNLFTISVSALSMYAILLCRSKNALSIMLLLIFFITLKKAVFFIIKDKSINNRVKFNIMITLFLFFGGFLIIVLNIVGVVISDLQFTYQSPYTNSILKYLDSISSGRVYVYQTELIRFTDHIFLGNGFGSVLGQAKSHNWILELLVQRGIIGLGIYLYCIINIFKTGFRFYKTDKMTRACINLLLIIFIQGLAEVTVFTIGIDFLIWSISGFLMARIKQLRLQEQFRDC